MVDKTWFVLRVVIVLAAIVVAFVAPKRYAVGWSDGARLAAIESLAERGTFAIDGSIYTTVPPDTSRPLPFNPADAYLFQYGTQDRMFVNGNFYSHHPPVPLLFGAAVHKAWLMFGGTTAAERPDRFAKIIGVATTGLPFAIAVFFIAWLSSRGLKLPPRSSFALVAAFAIATVAPAYTRHVNAHIPLLAITAILCALCADMHATGLLSRFRAVALGTLGGVAYGFDSVIGPLTLLTVTVFVVWVMGWRRGVLVVLMALPWLVLHHGIGYAITGSWAPPATVPEHFRYPGSPFSPDDLTGVGFKHSPLGFCGYLYSLGFGERGFFPFNLPIYFAPIAAVLAFRDDRLNRPIVVGCVTVIAMSVLPYALTSNNLAGVCLSIRWFVPLLAPAFWMIGLLLQTRPGYLIELGILTVGGAIMLPAFFRLGPYDAVSIAYHPAVLQLTLYACLFSLAVRLVWFKMR